MTYSYLTFAQAKSALAQRLVSASTSVFWPDAELGRYIREALRVWNAAAQFYRDRFTFSATANVQPFYDLGTQSNSLVTRTLQDRDLVLDLEDMLMEPVNDFSSSSAWAGSEQFNMTDLVDAIQRRRDQFLLLTGCIQVYSTPTTPSPPITTVSLGDTIVDVRRLAWQDITSGRILGLTLEDEAVLNRYAPRSPNVRDLPSQYSLVTAPPLTVRLSPPAQNVGLLHMVSVNSGAALDVTTGVALGIPQDFVWAIKYGALSDLLGKDSESTDQLRAQYCEQRFMEGVQLARVAAGPVMVQVNGVNVLTMPMQDFDDYDSRWQSTTAAVPTSVATAGMNLLVLNRVPTTAHALTVDCVRNMPVPSVNGDFIQVGREHLDVILDYAYHLSMFKCAGAEWQATMGHYGRLMQLAADNNSRLKANSQMFPVLMKKQVKERDRRPSREIDLEEAVA